MDLQRFEFLKATLGEDGAKALAKAAERSPALAAVLVPRAILAWLQLQESGAYEGELPGVENSYLSLARADQDFTGVIAVGESSYGFEGATLMQLAASIGVALGVDADQLDPSLRDIDLRNLGKSIDLLAKARKTAEDILVKRVLDPSGGYELGARHDQGVFGEGNQQSTTIFAKHPSLPNGHVGEVTFSHNPDGKTLMPETSFVHPEHRRMGLASAMYAHAEKLTGKKVVPSPLQSENAQGLWSGNQANPQFGKAEGPGPAAPPQQHGAPQEPTVPQKQPKAAIKPAKKPSLAPKSGATAGGSAGGQPAMQAATKLPQVKLTRSQTQRPCPVCGLSNFKGERLVGCSCFADLAKSADAVRGADGGFLVTFGHAWEPEAIQVFLEGILGRATSP